MERKRIIAWIALIFFIAIVVNILFVHVYVTESVTIFMLYFLFFFFWYNKKNTDVNKSITPENMEDDENIESLENQGDCESLEPQAENLDAEDNDIPDAVYGAEISEMSDKTEGSVFNETEQK